MQKITLGRIPEAWCYNRGNSTDVSVAYLLGRPNFRRPKIARLAEILPLHG